MADFQTSEGQDHYRAWCKTRPQIPIFMQDWWLDEVCKNRAWSAVLVEDKSGVVRAALPFQKNKYFGQTLVIPPLMTPYMGPWIAINQDDNRTYHREKRMHWILMRMIAEALPSAAILVAQFPPEVDDWLPFKWLGYQQTTKYTFVLENISDPQACFDAFKGSTRTNIRKAEALIRVAKTDDISSFYQIHQKSFIRQGKKSPISEAMLSKLFQASSARGLAEIRLAIDDADQVHAGVLTVHDAQKVYVLVSGIDTSLGNNGALYLLYWKVIQDYSGRVMQLDFEGSMLPNVAPVFLSFGTRQVPYLRVFKFKNKWLEIAARSLNKVV